MIERNRGTDKDDISRLESKIKALESDIIMAKQQGEERSLNKLEQSIHNTTVPILADTSLLDPEEGSPEKLLPVGADKGLSLKVQQSENPVQVSRQAQAYLNFDNGGEGSSGDLANVSCL